MLRKTRSISVVTVIISLSALATQFAPSQVGAQEEREPMPSAASMVSPYELVCSSCHDNRSEESLAPSRQALRELAPERVVEALSNGPMAVFGEQFSEDEKRAMAELITGKPFGGTEDRTAAAMSNQCSAPLTLDDPFGKPGWNGWTPDPTKSYRFQSEEAGGLSTLR